MEIIYGPPGTGKTSELLKRIKLSENNKTSCFVSFTKAAAREMMLRADVEVNISTIHGLAFRSLGLTRPQVMGPEDYQLFTKLTGFEISGHTPEDQVNLSIGDVYLSAYSLYKNMLHDNPIETFETGIGYGSPKEFKFFVKKYEEFKSAYGKYDFADMLTLALTSTTPKKPHYDRWCIDEAQDLSRLQWKLIEYWCSGSDVVVAGDDDQSIYSWGGADPKGMFNFEMKYGVPSTVLNQSHRIPSTVHKVAESIIANVKDRVEKEYKPKNVEGQVRRFDSEYSIPIPKHGEDVLFLYRNHSMREKFESIMVENRIPYVVDSGKPGKFNSLMAKTARSLLTAIRDYKNTGRVFMKRNEKRNMLRFCVGYEKNIHKDDFGFITQKPWYNIIQHHDYENLQYLKDVHEKHGLDCQPTIHLSTIHGSKGREANRVVVLNALGERSLENSLIDPDSEFRNFYVAVTRAKDTLDIVYGQNALSI